MSEWQPIETAPKDGTEVLLFSSYVPSGDCGETSVARWHRRRWKLCGTGASGNAFEYSTSLEQYKITHWMPLPDPPSSSSERK